jgi:hypothetical protein
MGIVKETGEELGPLVWAGAENLLRPIDGASIKFGVVVLREIT